MAINRKDYPKEYSIFEFVSRQYKNGMLIDDERIRFYKSKASMYKKMFESNCPDDRRENYKKDGLVLKKD